MLKKTGKAYQIAAIILLMFGVFVFMPSAGDCFEVKAHVDRNTIPKDDSIVLSIEVGGGKADIDTSVIEDFKVLSSGTTSSMNYINGKLDRKATYTYVLLPQKSGELIIPPIKARRDGETAYTGKIVIQVSEKAVVQGGAKELFAVSEITQNELVAGQQAVYTLRFYTTKRLSGLGYQSPPVFEGVSSRAFEKENAYLSNINGVQYQVTEVNYLLTAETPGTYQIDPPVLIANVMVKSRRDPRFDSFFNDSFFSSTSSRPVRVSSTPVEITVTPLPVYQGSGTFSGLIGTFKIEASVDTLELKTGDSVTYTLKISGNGNIMDAGLPEMKIDETVFKSYDDNPAEDIRMTSSGYEGHKIFKKAIVPVSPGKHVIKPVELVYFDVDEKAYKRIFTQPVQLEVLPSGEIHQAGPPSDLSPVSRELVKKEVHYENWDIFEIKEGLEVLKDYRDISPLVFFLCMAAPGFLFAGIKIFTTVRKKEIPVQKQMLDKAKHHLKQAEKKGWAHKDFPGHLYSALVAFVLSKGGRRGESVTGTETRAIFKEAGIEDARTDEVIGLFDTIESIRFGNRKIDETRAASIFKKTKEMIRMISIAAICICLVGGAPSKGSAAQKNEAQVFIEAINSYKSGDYEGAAGRFETIVQQDIKNPYLFYNIGNAYLKAQQIGKAILWYERAKLLIPADPDLNFNLQHARSFVKDKKEEGGNVIDTLFFWDNFFRIRTLQIATIAACALFFIWASGRTLRQQRIFSGIGVCLLAAALFLSVIVAEHYLSRSIRPEAVIITPEAPVRSGVSDTATRLFSLHEGTKVIVKDRKKGYLKIVFSNGKSGWVKADQAEII